MRKKFGKKAVAAACVCRVVRCACVRVVTAFGPRVEICRMPGCRGLGAGGAVRVLLGSRVEICRMPGCRGLGRVSKFVENVYLHEKLRFSGAFSCKSFHLLQKTLWTKKFHKNPLCQIVEISTFKKM